MNTYAKFDSRVQFWSLLGPFLTVLTLLLVLLKPSSYQGMFPALAIAGVFLCWKWKWRGLLLSISFLVLIGGYYYSKIPIEDRFWFAGFSMALASSFLVSFLSFEEASELVCVLQTESKSRLDHVLQLDEKIKAAEEEFIKEKRFLSSELTRVKEEVAQKQLHLDTNEKFIETVRREQRAIVENHEKIVQETQMLRIEVVKLEQQIEFLQQNEKIAQQQLELCNQELLSQKEANEMLSKSFHKAEEEQILHQAIVQEMNDHIETLGREKSLLETTIVRLQSELDELIALRQKEISTPPIPPAVIPPAPPLVETLAVTVPAAKTIQLPPITTTRIESLYLQLCEQFEEKSANLDKTRRELFLLQEKFLEKEKEWEELNVYGKSEMEQRLEEILLKTEEELEYTSKEKEHLEELVTLSLKR